MKQKVCLITGGAGFLGRKYCEFFLKKKYIVLCIDNNKKNLKSINSIKSIYSKNLITYDCDITSDKKVERLFKLISMLGITSYILVVIVFGIQFIVLVGAQKTPALQIPIGFVYFAFPIAGIHMFFESLIIMIKVKNAGSIEELNRIKVVAK